MSPSPDADAAREPIHDRALAELGSTALGEPADPAIADHIARCATCRAELVRLQGVVDLARGDRERSRPPAAVWDRIAAEVGVGVGATGAEAVGSAPRPGDRGEGDGGEGDGGEEDRGEGDRGEVVPLRPSRRSSRNWSRRPSRRWLLAAAAVVLVGAAGAGGWVLGSRDTSSAPPQAFAASLRAQPGTAAGTHGTARVHRTDAGFGLVVDTTRLPPHDGYYEVWLYNPDANTMIPVGTLGTGGRGRFTVPGGLDLDDYRIVDVSAQRYNGNPAHDRSVLQGPLR